jgi:type II secretory pathway pseudopilin PulG
MGILTKRQVGFTIIEVMLFLAVSGALAAGVLGSSSVVINNQRYIDAANSFKALVQGEIIATTRVVNETKGDSTCIWDEVHDTPSSLRPVATSDCVIMGRALAIKSGQTIVTANIIGRSNSDDIYPSDIAAIEAHKPVLDTRGQKTSLLNWDTHIKGSESLIIYIFRSPQSGNIVIRSQRNVVSTAIDALMTSGFKVKDIATLSSSKQEICIDASGLIVAQQQTVIINANVSGPSGIEMLAGQSGCA